MPMFFSVINTPAGKTVVTKGQTLKVAIGFWLD